MDINKMQNKKAITIITILVLLSINSYAAYIGGFQQLRYSNNLTINSTALEILTSNVSRLYISKDGLVGIGTITPTAIADVAQGATTSTNIDHNDTAFTDGFAWNMTSLNVTSVSGFPGAGTLVIGSEAISYTGVDTILNTFTGLTRGALATTAANHTNNTAVYYLTSSVTRNTSLAPYTVVRSDGNVGIGILPTHTLTVSGDINVTGASYLGDIVITADNITLSELVAKGENITFFNATRGELIRITPNGRVGIGTPDPTSKLEVNGSINATTLYGDGSNLDGIRKNASYNYVYDGSDWIGMKATSAGVLQLDVLSQSLDSVLGDLTIADDLVVTGSANITGGLNVTGNVLIAGDLNVTGTTYLGSMSFMGGNITASLGTFTTLNVTGVSYLGSMTLESGNITATRATFTELNVTGYSYLGSMVFESGNITATLGTFTNLNVTGNAYLGDITINADNITLTDLIAKNENISFFNNSKDEKMRITYDGKVGIGTTSPESLLHVKGADGITGVIKIEGGNDAVAAVGENNSQLDFGSNDPSVAGGVGGRIVSVTEINNGARTGLGFHTYSQGADELSERMRIDYSGSVGIGTTTPSEKLEVIGNISVPGTLFVDNTSQKVGIGTTAPSHELNVIGDINATGNITSGTGTVFIDGTNSRIGIGTTTPAYTLDVQGSMKVSQNMTVGDNVLFENGEVLAINGKTNLSTLATVNDVYVYDTSKDSDGGAWTCDERARTTSWYNESLNTWDRGKTRCFPKRAILVGTDNNLTIYDASDNSMWMVFDKDSSNPYGFIADNTVAVFALNGKVYSANTGDNAWRGVHVVDFLNDRIGVYQSSRSTNSGWANGKGVNGRNDADFVSGDYDASFPGIVDVAVNDVHANIINGKTYVAVATGLGDDSGGGISVICEECNGSRGTVIHHTDSQYDEAGQKWKAVKVWLTSDGGLYWIWNDLDDGSATALVFHPTGATTASTNHNDAPQQPYHAYSIPVLEPSGVASANNVYNDIYVTEGTSTIDGSSNTIYVGGRNGVTVLQEKQSNKGNGSVKYYTQNYTSEEMVGDIRGYWNMETVNASGNLTDLSIKSNNGDVSGVVVGGVLGVRGNATEFNQATDYISVGNDSGLSGSISSSSSTSIWVKLNQLGHTGDDDSIFGKSSERWLLYDGDGTYGFACTSNVFCYAQYDGSWDKVESTTTPAVGQWYHIVTTHDGTNIRMYVNGVLEATTASGTITIVDSNLVIGGTGSSSYSFNGTIDEVMITATVLTPSQIKHMYETGLRSLAFQNQTGLSNRTRLFGSGGNVTSVAVDDKNQYIYVGVSDGSDNGGVSVIGKDSDVLLDWYGDSSKTTDDGTVWNADDIQSISVHDGIVAIGTDTEVWLQAPDISTEDHIRENFNPHGANLVQDKLTTNKIHAKDGNIIELGVAIPPQQSPSSVSQEDLILKIDRNLSITKENTTNPELFVDVTNQRVGIGTTTPAFKIDTGTGANQARIGSAELGDWSAASTYSYFGNEALDQTLTTNYALLQAPDGTTFLNAPTGKNINFRINNADQMVLDSSGNVIIGTTATTAPSNRKLVIGTDSGGTLVNISASAGQSFIYLYSAQGSNSGIGFIDISDPTNDGYQMNYDSGNNRFRLLGYDTDGGGTAADLIRIPDGQETVDFTSTADETAFDYAEYMPKLNPEDEFGKGDVVGIKEGKVTHNTEDTELIMVITTDPGVRGGNAPFHLTEEQEEEYYNSVIDVAFIGQVPAKVTGKANPGDYILPSGKNDGTAIAKPKSEVTFEEFKTKVAGVILNKFTMPKNTRKTIKPVYEEMLRKAADSDYDLYLVAVGVK